MSLSEAPKRLRSQSAYSIPDEEAAHIEKIMSHFKDYLPSERWVLQVTCAFRKRGIYCQGTMYLTTKRIGFSSPLVQKDVNLPLSLVTSLKKSKTARFINNAFTVCTKEKTYIFSSFINRDKVWKQVYNTWQREINPSVNPDALPEDDQEHYAEGSDDTDSGHDQPLNSEEEDNYDARGLAEEEVAESLIVGYLPVSPDVVFAALCTNSPAADAKWEQLYHRSPFGRLQNPSPWSPVSSTPPISSSTTNITTPTTVTPTSSSSSSSSTSSPSSPSSTTAAQTNQTTSVSSASAPTSSSSNNNDVSVQRRIELVQSRSSDVVENIQTATLRNGEMLLNSSHRVAEHTVTLSLRARQKTASSLTQITIDLLSPPTNDSKYTMWTISLLQILDSFFQARSPSGSLLGVKPSTPTLSTIPTTPSPSSTSATSSKITPTPSNTTTTTATKKSALDSALQQPLMLILPATMVVLLFYLIIQIFACRSLASTLVDLHSRSQTEAEAFISALAPQSTTSSVEDLASHFISKLTPLSGQHV